MSEQTQYPNGKLSEEAEIVIDMERLHASMEKLDFGSRRPILLGRGESLEPMLTQNDNGEEVEVLRLRRRALNEDLYAYVGGLGSGLVVARKDLLEENKMLNDGADGQEVLAKQREFAHDFVAGTKPEVVGVEAGLQEVRALMVAASMAVRQVLVAA